MLAAVGLAVSRVIRVRYDTVALGELYRGASRPLSPGGDQRALRAGWHGAAPQSGHEPSRIEGDMKRFIAWFALLLCSFSALAQDKIIVSGASGQLGSLVIEELLARKVAPENLILVSRTPNTEHLQGLRRARRERSVRRLQRARIARRGLSRAARACC